MKSFYKYMDKIPKTFIPIIGVLMTIFLGCINHLTGYEISFSIFYLLPIIFVSWFGKRTHGVIASVFSAEALMWADLSSDHFYSNFAIPVWNSIMVLGFFLLITFSFAEIKKLLTKEQLLARVDPLTGLANSRAFDERATNEINRSIRFARPFSIAFIDIDNFKQVNDMLGHSQGDNLLQSIAKTIKDNTRSIDIVSRVGGDEFVIFFSETNEKNAKEAINKVRERLFIMVKNNNLPVTFSIGVVTCYKSCNLDELIKAADNLMYSVKRSGKNRIEFKIHV